MGVQQYYYSKKHLLLLLMDQSGGAVFPPQLTRMESIQSIHLEEMGSQTSICTRAAIFPTCTWNQFPLNYLLNTRMLSLVPIAMVLRCGGWCGFPQHGRSPSCPYRIDCKKNTTMIDYFGVWQFFVVSAEPIVDRKKNTTTTNATDERRNVANITTTPTTEFIIIRII